MIIENLFAVSDPPAIAGEVEDLAAMYEAVSKHSVAEDFSPALEAFVGSNDNRGVFVEFGDECEEEIGFGS